MTLVLLVGALVATRPHTSLLGHARVVLVGPSQPGNVGMISRAMANFEVEELYLVNPEYDRSDPENGSFERRFAMQDHAKTILSEAKVCGTLTQALAGCISAVGFTRRRGNMRSGGNDVVVGGLAQLGATQRMALVFGREADGLRSDELLLCTHTCEIPTSGRQGSMSLPAACTVALSRTFESALALESGASDEGAPPRILGGDTTTRRAARLPPPSLAGKVSHAGTSAADVDVTVSRGGGSQHRPATIEELEHLIIRWESLIARSTAVPKEAGPSAGVGADQEADAKGQGGGWVRTARGSRASTSHGRAAALLKRMLQRAVPSSRELRMLHGVLRQMENL